jgi:hypothetical protein
MEANNVPIYCLDLVAGKKKWSDILNRKGFNKENWLHPYKIIRKPRGSEPEVRPSEMIFRTRLLKGPIREGIRRLPDSDLVSCNSNIKKLPLSCHSAPTK